jgi:5,10-methylenetetrahydromethanopterin reductase
MMKIGLGLPGLSVNDVRSSAEAARNYAFDSFSVYGDLGDLPPYAVLHASSDILQGSVIGHVGPLGVPVGMQQLEIIAQHAIALEQQLPGQSSIGLVRGAFLETIGDKPASLSRLADTIAHIRQSFGDKPVPPIYIGGFGPRILDLAGRLAVQGVKLGGSANPAMAERARKLINNPGVEIVLGAVSVIDPDRKAARACARAEIAKYLAVVGELDPTLDDDGRASLDLFMSRFRSGDNDAGMAISDSLLDNFALAGTPDDALAALARMSQYVDRFEFGTPHGLNNDRVAAIHYIGESIVEARP